jgi:RNA recognition motif-containing protein
MKVYIGNLPFSFDDAKLKQLFSNYEVEEATIIMNKFNGRSKGFGFVSISDDESAKRAIEEFNGKDIEGRELKVSEAKPFNPDENPRPRRSFGGGSRDGPRRSFGGNRDRNFGGNGRSFGGRERRF